MRRVYARYRTSADPGVPMDRPGGAAFYAAALLDAFAKDSALAHGEVGAIDSDPICDCQAYGKLRVKKVALTWSGASKVEAEVNFDNLDHHEAVVLTLSRTAAGWRIADVGSKGMKSVLAVLQKSIAHPIQPDK